MSERWKEAPLARKQNKPPANLEFMNRGIATTLGAPVDVINALLSRIGLGSERPIGGSRSLIDGMNAVGEAIDGTQISAEPEELADTYGERIMQGVGNAAGFLVPGGLVARELAKGAGTTAAVANSIIQPFARRPAGALTAEMLAGAAAGAGGLKGEQIAANNDVDPALGRALGEITGGLGGALTASAPRALIEASPVAGILRKGASAAAAPFTRRGGTERAQRRVRGLSADPAADAARIADDTLLDLTPAQRTGNTRLMALEKAARANDPSLDARIAARDPEGKAREMLTPDQQDISVMQAGMTARRDKIGAQLQRRVDDAQARAQERVAALAPAQRESQAAMILRQELDAAYQSARANERELWDAVPTDVRIPTSNVVAEFNSIRANLARAQQEDMPAAARLLDQDRNSAFGSDESAREMYGLYSKLREQGRQARANGDNNTARIAGRLADAVLKDIESVPEDGLGAAYAAARGFSRELNQKFTQGRVGAVLGSDRDGGLSVPPEETLARTVSGGGVRAAVGVDELRAALGDNATAEGAIADYLKGRFTAFTSPRGEFKPERATDFLRQNAELLAKYPELRAEIQAAADAGLGAQRTAATAASRQKMVDDTPGSKMAVAPQMREFEFVAKANYPTETARSLAREAKRDPSGKALDGLKASARNYIVQQTNGKVFSGDRLLATLDDARVGPALREIFDEAEIDLMRRIGTELRRANASSLRADPEGVMNDEVNSLVSMIGRTFGARMGAQAGQGTSGASLLTANFASRRMQKIMQGLTNNTAERVIRRALEDPDKMRDLLTDVTTPAGQEALNRLAPWIAGIVAQSAGDREDVPRWKLAPLAD